MLVLLRAYCDFYAVTPTDRDLRAVMLGLLAAGGRDGLQLLARDALGEPVGFATLLFTWSTTGASRAAVMNDLYIAQDGRGQGLAEALIDRCQIESAHHGAAKLTWITRRDNNRAQAVYDRVGAHHDPWVNYRIDLPRRPLRSAERRVGHGARICPSCSALSLTTSTGSQSPPGCRSAVSCCPPPATCTRQPSSRSPTPPAATAPSPDYPTAPPASPPSN